MAGIKSLSEDSLRFVYKEPVIILEGRRRHIVIGDLHIGSERRFHKKGMHIYGHTDMMVKRILEISKTFDTDTVVLLGDIKDSLLYPDRFERDCLDRFFYGLRDLDITALRGNHDSHLEEILRIRMQDELLLDEVALLHGNKLPSEKAVGKNMIITGHNHVAIEIVDKNGARYYEKGWLISKARQRAANKFYKGFLSKKMVTMPAFNELITGVPVGARDEKKRNINPLFSNHIFDYENAEVYTLYGEYCGVVGSFKSKKYSSHSKSAGVT